MPGFMFVQPLSFEVAGFVEMVLWDMVVEATNQGIKVDIDILLALCQG